MGENSDSQKRQKSALGLLLRIAVTVGVGIWISTLVDVDQLRDVFGRMSPGWWAALAAVTMGIPLLHALRWHAVLRSLGEQPTHWELFTDLMVGSSYNLILPTTVGGDVVRAYRCGRRLEQPHRAWSSALYERLAGFVATALCALLAALAAGNVLGQGMWVVLGITGVLTAVFWRAEIPVRMAAKLAQGLGGAPAKWASGIRTDFEGPLTARGLRIWVLLLSIGGVVLTVLLGWCTAAAMDVQGATLALAVALPVAQLTAAIPVSINGLGLREGTIVLVLGAYGLDEPFAVAVALILLAAVFLLGAVGLVFIALAPAEARQMRAEDPT